MLTIRWLWITLTPVLPEYVRHGATGPSVSRPYLEMYVWFHLLAYSELTWRPGMFHVYIFLILILILSG